MALLAELDTTLCAVVLAVALALFLGRGNLFANPVALSRDKYCELTLVERTELTPNVVRLRFALPTSRHILGLPTGRHATLALYDADGKSVTRTYTPVSGNDLVGFMEIVIKAYFKQPPRFPEGGKMSQLLWNMSIGDKIRAMGPKGHMEYKGNGTFHIKHPRSGSFAAFEETKSVQRVGMIAGGTGLTPMLQVVTASLKDPTDKTEFSLLFANQSPEDVMLKAELDALAAAHPRFKVWYTVDRAAPGWEFSEGFINAEMIQNHMPAPDPSMLLLVCGPPPMLKFACLPAFEKLGYSEANVLFEGMPKSTRAIFAEFRDQQK